MTTAIGELLRAARPRTRGVDQAIRGVLTSDARQLVARWHRATHAATTPLRDGTGCAGRYGPRLVA